MKKIISVLLVLTLMTLSGCVLLAPSEDVEVDPTENAQAFYDKVCESEALIDSVATDICAVWKDSNYELSTKAINQKLEKVKKSHSKDIEKINELDAEICDLFGKAKDETGDGYLYEFALKRVMTEYTEYKDSVLNANAALDSSGYLEIESAKEFLDSALRDLFVEL